MKLRDPELRLENFGDMNLSPAVSSALEKMSIRLPTPVQTQAIPTSMSGSDMIAIAPAGTGKTIAFALSILKTFEQKPASRALILVPSREVATQIFSVFETLCSEDPIKACLVIGGEKDNNQYSQLRKMPRIIVATPGRMNDLLRENKLLLQGVAVVVIDEADRMLDLGFTGQLKQIQSTMRGERQTMLFSATFNPNVQQLAEIFMREDVVMLRSEGGNAPASTLSQTVFFLPGGKKNALLIEELKLMEGSVIVFTGSQESAEIVGEHLRQNGQSVDLIHGELSQGHRSRVVRDFRDAKFRVLVTTDLLARGLDVPDVALVVNFDLPYKTEDFLHRIGRTARAGRSGTAITFITPEDRDTFKKIQPYVKGAREVSLDGPPSRPSKSKKY
ncbi:MAG: DEAD/DEAH box helicase [Bdellovibrionota bacterium]